ncbi:uncharacterized protein LOC134801497 [Cydia splendana]|uniref:uncharacterized protein LOC134801497 n=1 Tax=Cydia splendana TaxID=1100963 RepID=UPI00300C8254
MQDANCRDGTVTVYTESAVNENVTWFPVTTSGFIDMKIATRGPCWIVLARSRSIGSRFKRMFYYGFGEEQYDRTYYGIVALLKDEEEGPWDERKKLVHASYYRGKYKYDSAHINHTQFLRDGTKYQWRLTWNETTGSVLFDMILRDGTTFVPPNGRLQHSSAEYAYPVRYIGLAGGNASYPTWWELTGPGNPRGYLMAYRGRCREDIQPLPTEPPSNLRDDLDINMYNFAERMDEFGYNFSRAYSTPAKR